ncbi:hypothetical protein F5Y19DRAFT_445629 [Xylariaceae sp. FL1651]|nr:hypothetical protein F5Y19DRAFT_445629 [Xylariaceae sp. FL1651]
MPAVILGQIEAYPIPPVDAINGARNNGFFTGQILMANTVQRAGLSHNNTCNSEGCLSDISFRCEIPSVFPGASASDPIASVLCMPKNNRFAKSTWKIGGDPWTPTAVQTLVFTTNVDPNAWYQLFYDSTNLPPPIIQDEWAVYNLGSGYVINATLCFNAFNAMLSNVSMATQRDLTEPNLVSTSDSSDMASIRNFLGVNPMVQDLNERGVLSLDSIIDLKRYDYGAANSSESLILQHGIDFMNTRFQYHGAINTTIAGCTMCISRGSRLPSPCSRTFTDVINTTWRASVAIQTLYTLLASSVSEQVLKYGTSPLPVDIVQTQSSTVPTDHVGLGIVATLVFLNMLCIFILTTMYIVYSSYSMIGSFWHAVSPVASDVTAEALSQSNMRRDREIRKLIRGNEYQVRLMEPSETGFIKLERVSIDPNPSRA